MIKLLAVLPLVALVCLAGCGPGSDKPSAKPAASAPASSSAAPTPPAAPAPYDATLADGIQFSRDGYPRFVREVSGVSTREEFGRWTDGPEARFTFADALPKKFTLTIETAWAFGPNVGDRLRVKAGDWSGEANLTSQSQTLKFAVTSSTAPTAIQLTVPAPTSPKQVGVGDDPRMLGVALKRLSITTP